MVKVGISGFGRIGRLALRRILSLPDVEVVAINNRTVGEIMAHLLKYDSVHGTMKEDVAWEDGFLVIDGKKIPVTSETDVTKIPWGKYGADIVLEIDWQGAQQVRTVFGERMVGIFILPPSLQVLEARLSGRATDDAATIARRLAAARGEMRHAADADYVILNDDLSVASAQLHAVIQAARLRTCCQRARHADYFQLFEKD